MKKYRVLLVLFSIPAIILFVKIHIYSEIKNFHKHPTAITTGNLALLYCYDEITNEFPNRTKNPKNTKQPPIDQSDIILMGDSYSHFYNGESIYGYLTKKGHVVRNHFSLDINKTDKKKVVFFICGKLTLSTKVMRDLFAKHNVIINSRSLSKRILDIVFPENIESKYNLILNRSYYTFEIVKELNSLRHRIYGERSRKVIYVDHPKTILYNRPTVEALERDSSTIKKELDINTKILLEMENSLKKKGYQLYIVIAPLKSEIIPLKLDYNTEHSHDIVAQTLSSEGFQVIDATPMLKKIGPSSYTRTDTHWSSVAMKTVADSLSQVANSYQKR